MARYGVTVALFWDVQFTEARASCVRRHPAPEKEKTPGPWSRVFFTRISWLPGKDLNPHVRIQSPLSYH